VEAAERTDVQWAALELRRRRAEDPLGYHVPSPPQILFHQDPSRFRILRGGNQSGKTVCGAVEMLWRMLGVHPYLETTKVPIHCRVITYSWDQSRTVARKIHELLPPSELHPDSEFHPDRGFKYHQFRLKNGSFCEIFTTRQGSLANASATLDVVWVDEPPPIELWSELVARIMAKRGHLFLTMTPIGRPVGWLKDKVSDGEIKDHRFSVTAANCPWYDQEQIDEIEKLYLPHEVPQRLHGAWEGYLSERLFKGFQDDHVRDEVPMEKATIGIGLDHGTDAGSQVAILVAISHAGDHPKIWVLDEYVSDSTSTPEEDARAIMRMLDRNRLSVDHVDRWVGDRAHGGKRWGGAKSNRMLMTAFEREMRIGVDRLPFKIRTVKKGRGSVWHGCRVIHSSMLRGDFVIRPHCSRLIESLKNWQGRDDEFKHAIDALRYSAVDLLGKTAHNPHRIRIF
jgi:hypothetical protein